MTRAWFPGVALCVLWLAGACQCSVIRVKADGSDANDGSTWELAKKTVQAGINAATSGDEVWVAKGTYLEGVMLKHGVGLYGGFSGVEVAREQRDRKRNVTTLDRRDNGPTVYAPTNAGPGTVIDGFTIGNSGPYGRVAWSIGVACEPFSSPRICNNTVWGCRLYQGGGAGISCASHSSPDIVDNTISGNSVAHGAYGSIGGGIYCDSYSSPKISGNLFAGNSAAWGSAIACSSSTATIRSNTFLGNHATYNGFGFTVHCGGSGTLVEGNTFLRNYVQAGAAIYCANGSPTVTGNVIADTDGYSHGAAIRCGEGSPTIANNTITGNKSYGVCCGEATTPSLSNNIVAFTRVGICVEADAGVTVLRNNCVYSPDGSDYYGVAPGEGDLSADPGLADRTGGNYHLRPNSPCVNTGWNVAPGLPATDLDGRPRILGNTVDIGAYEFLATSVPEAKLAVEGAPVELQDEVVSASLPDAFYVESGNRSSGVRVEKPDHGTAVGDRASVAGAVRTNSDGERCIQPTTVTTTGTGSIAPIAVTNRDLGGGTLGYQQGVWGWWMVQGDDAKLHRQWMQVGGPNNVGLLVKTWGRITGTGAGWFRIDDGSDVGLRCILPDGVAIDPAWEYVSVTGIVSCERVGDELRGILRVRTQADIVPR